MKEEKQVRNEFDGISDDWPKMQHGAVGGISTDTI